MSVVQEKSRVENEVYRIIEMSNLTFDEAEQVLGKVVARLRALPRVEIRPIREE